MITRLRSLREERGAMLVIALIIITTVALVTGAVLAHGWTNFRATVNLRGVAGTSYAADSAAKVAINNLRLGAKAPDWVSPSFPGPWADWVYTNSADGTGCFGANGTAPQDILELKNLYPPAGEQKDFTSARVECSPVPGTGIFGPGSGVGVDDPDPTDAFARALTTVGTSGARQGITVKPLGTGNTAALPIRGGVASKSFVTVESGALTSDGYVWAEGACTGTIIAVDKVCNAPGKVPAYATPPSPLASVPAYRDPATQGCNFQPGFYNDAVALSTAVNACSVAKFASGQYYFDFRNAESGGENVWHVGKPSGSTTVIGGEYVGTSIPGGCKSPINNDPVPGVQFVFGADSRMVIEDSARVELCGPSNGGEAPMTLYQQQTGSSPAPVAVPASGAATATTVTSPGAGKNDAFKPNPTTATLAQALSTTATPVRTADWKSTKDHNTGELDLQNFPGLSGIPVGSTITSAKLNVTYTKSLLATATFKAGVQGQSAMVDVAPSGTDTDVTALLNAQFASGAFTATNPTIRLLIGDSLKNDTMAVDAVSLKVTYVEPSLRKAVDTDFIMNQGGNFAGRFVIQGATFAPNGFVSLIPGSDPNALVAFRWGLVALGAEFKAQPSQTFGYPLVSIPSPGKGLGNKLTVVDLKVYVCVEKPTCASGGTRALSVRAMITDPPYTGWGGGPPRPEPGRRQVQVLSWSEQN